MKISLIRLVEFKNNKTLHPRDIIPSFELLNIISLLDKNQNEIEHIDNEVLKLTEKEFTNMILRKNSDLYIFQFQPIVSNAVLRILKKLNKKSKITMAFGPTIEYQAEYFLRKSGLTFATFSEPELTIKELIDNILNNNIKKTETIKRIKGIAFIHKNIFYKNELREFLNPGKLPYLAHEYAQNDKYKVVSKVIVPKEKIKWGFLLSSRGCPYNCSFCAPSIRYSKGKIFRAQKPERTVREIEYMIKKFNINAISFEDDIFTFDKKRVLLLCKLIIKRKIKISWTMATRLDCLDQQLVKIMKRAGCEGISTGVESGNDKILQKINKGENIETMKRGINMLKKENIAITINIIIGHPEETIRDIILTKKLIKELDPLFIHVHLLTPYPGVKLFKNYFVQLDQSKKLSHRLKHNFNVSNIDTKLLHKMIGKLYFSHYFRINFLKKYLKYKLNYWIYDPVFEIKFLIETFNYFISMLRNN